MCDRAHGDLMVIPVVSSGLKSFIFFVLTKKLLGEHSDLILWVDKT